MPPPTSAPRESAFRTKGLTYRALLAHIERTVPGGLAAVSAALDRERATFAAQPFLATGWYDFLQVVPLSEAGARLAGQEIEPWLRAASRAAAEEQANGLYRFLLSLVSDESIAMWIPRLTERYFDFGTLETTRVAPGHVRMLRTGTPALCVEWYRVVGPEYVITAIDLARKGTASTHVTSKVVATRRDARAQMDVVDIQFECFVR